MPWESRKSRASIVWDEPKTVTGTLRHVEAVAFDDHETKLYTIEVNGVLETAWGGTILDRQLRPTDLNHRIEITYAGKQRSKAGREFHNFEVRVWTDGPDADGGRLPPPEDATLADEPPSGDEAADADVPF